MRRIVFLFPGQGSQFLGMGHDLFNEYDFVREIFNAADETAKKNISELCFKGPRETLLQTSNLQLAITATNLACLSSVERAGITCDIAMGHSLGEYSALRAARILSLSDAMRVVFSRGKLMEREAAKHKGLMYAIIGLERAIVESLIKTRQNGGVVSIANQNSINQIIISGDVIPVREVALEAKKKSARIIPLEVSGAWHSALMKGVEREFAAVLDMVFFKDPLCRVIHNVNCEIASELDELKNILVRQICEPVLWYDSLCKLASEKIDVFVELGPGRVLTGLLKKVLPTDLGYKVFNVSDMRTLEKFLHDIT